MILTYIAWIVLLFAFYIVQKEYDSLPDQVPVKYDFDGSVKHMGSKSTLYLLVGVGFLMAILLTGILYTVVTQSEILVLEAIHLLCQLLFFYIIFQTIKVVKGKAKGLDKVFFVLMIAVIFLPILLVIFKVD